MSVTRMWLPLDHEHIKVLEQAWLSGKTQLLVAETAYVSAQYIVVNELVYHDDVIEVSFEVSTMPRAAA